MKQLFFLLLWVGIALPLAAQTPQEQPAVQASSQGEKAAAPASADTKPADGNSPVTGSQPASATAATQDSSLSQDLAEATAPKDEKQAEEFVAARETVEEEEEDPERTKVVYAPKSDRDPTLSPDDFLLLQYREQQRLAAIEAERKRKLEEERRRQEEAERLRQLELARIKDPTREVRNKIKIGGVIGQEVFIGSKIYTVGNSIYGARIIAVRPDEVVFSYKGHKFVRKVQL